MDYLKEQQWIVIAALFFGVIVYISIRRWLDQHWIEKRFGKNNIRAVSFGVNYYGRSSELGPPRRSSGFLILLPDGLFYRSRWRKLEVHLPSPRMLSVYHDNAHKGVDLNQSIVKIEFLTEEGKKDSVAFKVPYPPQWIQAIGGLLPENTDER